MRGDQLTPQWRATRAIEARPNGLTMVEIAACDGHRGPYRRSPSKACSKSWTGLFCFRETEADRLFDPSFEGPGLMEKGD